MDHLIEKIIESIYFDFDNFYRELSSGKFGSKYTNQPSYKTLKAEIDSVNILNKYMGYGLISIKKMVLERE